MQFSKVSQIAIFVIGSILVLGQSFLWPTSAANAQCGSQASSCKNCHEVQGQDPVNNDGSGWHASHAFGDFCYICHAGNNQSMDANEAHAGMVSPLSDVQASCASCHPSDLTERAQVYAVALGVEVGSGVGTSPSLPASTTAQEPSNAGSSVETSADLASEIAIDSTEVIDYTRQYEETVLGRIEINWGNVTLVTLILLIGLGGGSYVIWNERRLRTAKLSKTGVKKSNEADTLIPLQAEGLAPEVAALLPKISALNPLGLHALKRLLDDPEAASELLRILSRLDPELIRRLRSLDRDTRVFLLAIANQ